MRHTAPAAEPRAPVFPTSLVLLGHPVAHSLSPRFQQAALDAAGLAIAYRALDTASSALTSTLDSLAAERAAGNVTIPHKQAVFQRCTQLTAVAEQVGAVNTFWHDANGRLVGHNTDVEGARAALNAVAAGWRGADAAPLRSAGTGADRPGSAPARVVLLGAGGAAAAVIRALAHSEWTQTSAPVQVTVCARTPERAAALVARSGAPAAISDHSEAALRRALAHADLVVNCTPIGLHDDQWPAPIDALPSGAAVLDLVYRSGETAWVRAARERGHAAEDGLRMLVEQGAAAFEAWFGRSPSKEAMWGALRAPPDIPHRQ